MALFVLEYRFPFQATKIIKFILKEFEVIYLTLLINIIRQ